ncbi:F-box/kelch-repeat protein At3g06240-like [Lycium ferocissimum]|uniref:F-box/kelch-repeat protein At3g06240-like n=1 Tax=Lycium ferocissimum TaxID=112874 RepID=UPI0028163A2A|nr:F-box/kelch-repeat protein At3g06240-like [Lycium ferocissimum]
MTVTEAFDLDYPMKEPHTSIATLPFNFGGPMKKSVWIVGSVNGLICLVIGVNNFFLYNPSIRKFKILPDPRPGLYVMYAFGYDELHDDYKVVAVCKPWNIINGFGYDKHHVEIKIYSLESDSWRSTEECWRGCYPLSGVPL